MEQEYGARPHYDQSNERIRVEFARRSGAPQKERVQNQDEHTTDKAELLAQHAKNEVGMFLGQKREVGLRSIAKTLAGLDKYRNLAAEKEIGEQ